MNKQTYETLSGRIEWLELQLNITQNGETPSIKSQLKEVQSSLNSLSSANSEFVQLYQYLNELKLWNKVQVECSDHLVVVNATDEKSLDQSEKKHIILAKQKSILDTLSLLEEINSLSLDSLINLNPEVISQKSTFLQIHSQMAEMMDNVNKLTISSLNIIESFIEFFVKQNEFWCYCENNLVQINKKLTKRTLRNMDTF